MQFEDYEIAKLEKEWLETQPYLSTRELLDIFPEAKPYLKLKLQDYKKKSDKLASEIRKDLKRIYKKKTDEFTIWFLEKIIEVWKGETLNWLGKEISKLEWLLFPKKVKGRITESQIEQARNYPFKDLVGTKKDFILCPFHKEKKPSFYLKNNWGYCFACGWHGDTIKFLMDKYNMTFVKAVNYLQ